MISPHTSSVMRVRPDWIDYNGHMNMAFYNVLFDHALDEFMLGFTLGPDYVKERNASFFTVEAHVCYHREVTLADPIVVRNRLVGFDDKRMHTFAEMFHAEEDWLAATSEQLFLHIDMARKKAARWPEDIRALMQQAADEDCTSPAPEQINRSISIATRRGPA